MKKKIGLILVLAASLVAGCVNMEVGKKIDRGLIQQIEPGRSTKDDIKELFHEPLRVCKGAGGEIWVYRHLNDDPPDRCELIIGFSEDVVSTFSTQ